jgi:hypothetical protein
VCVRVCVNADQVGLDGRCQWLFSWGATQRSIFARMTFESMCPKLGSEMWLFLLDNNKKLPLYPKGKAKGEG